MLYRGTTFNCTVCRWNFASLLPIEGQCSILGEVVDLHTPNADCPRCHSGIRQRFTFAVLKARTGIVREPLRILHFAPDPGIYAALTRLPNIDYLAADLNPARFVKATRLDITAIDLPAADVDGIICIHVLEHIADDVRAIAELFRVLRPRGWAAIAVPTYGDTTIEIAGLDFAGREREYGAGDHLRLNGFDFAGKLAAAGFNVEVIAIEDMPGNFVDRTVRSAHTESDRYVFLCRKPAD